MADIEHCSMNKEHIFRPITHYLRHSCPNCDYYQIFNLCAECAKVFEAYINPEFFWQDNWTYCPKCWSLDSAKAHWTVYKPVL